MFLSRFKIAKREMSCIYTVDDLIMYRFAHFILIDRFIVAIAHLALCFIRVKIAETVAGWRQQRRVIQCHRRISYHLNRGI